jgi:hypothetical protein
MQLEKEGVNMNKKDYVIDPLVKDRLEAIAAGGEAGYPLAGLQICEPSFFYEKTTVFSGMYQENDRGESGDVFIEISREPSGCENLNEALISVKWLPGLPCYYLKLNFGDLVIGVVYEKMEIVGPYENYLYFHEEQVPYFFSALKELIDNIHKHGVVLAPRWDDAGTLFIAKDKLPVFITYRGMRKPRFENEFALGCRDDWRTFNKLLHKYEKKSSADQAKIFEKIKRQVRAKLKETAVA